MLRIWKQFVIMGTLLLTLVRHGETAENKLKIVQGHIDTKLVDIGVKQAVLVGRRLENETFTHVFSSDLSRALETCEIIMKHNKANSASITSDSRLRERKLGVLEGQPHLNCYNAIKTNAIEPGMETKMEVRERAKSFFRELCRTISDATDSRTSTTSDFSCPRCKARSCECRVTEPSDPPQDSLCNVGVVGGTKHLKNGASLALENLPDRTESSSDEEHLGITPDVLRLGRDPVVSGSGDLSSDVRSPALNSCGKPGGEMPEGGGDDDDDRQLANVLLVSHGGFLMELVSYFFKELKCKRPSTEAAAPTQTTRVELPRQGIMSNAGVSRFNITINTRSAKATSVTCHYLNDRRHLLVGGRRRRKGEISLRGRPGLLVSSPALGPSSYPCLS